jgi:hypothetical protein
VKKRDKRFAKRQMERARVEKEAQAAAQRQRLEAKRAKALKAEQYKAADWTMQDEDGPQWLRDEIAAAERESAEREARKQDLFCPVCRKRFKSAKQWENHEQSKQHKAAVLRLKEEMMADEELVRVAMEEAEEEAADDAEDAHAETAEALGDDFAALGRFKARRRRRRGLFNRGRRRRRRGIRRVYAGAHDGPRALLEKSPRNGERRHHSEGLELGRRRRSLRHHLCV